ncbi:uncharacterized protein LOC110266257 [Arachis ipaensis]|uniref:uncharacterized protein LOC110266257 n=1 Tax=Arachis ipaensis TaxID=130454 RepID=UPI000A2B2997|nr:uncharacterized protein LOC110266257 [Arachis ipaensis]XP_025676960.1 uncharacterized protein LOC112776903 [Arachis hypogaea]
MTAYDMDPDVVRWGLHNLLDVCTLSNNGSPSIITRYDLDLSSSVEYVREGFYQPSYVENDEAVARAYLEELSQLQSLEASGMSKFGNDQARAAVLAQDWHSYSDGSINFGAQVLSRTI